MRAAATLRVHTARQPEDDLLVADLGTDAFDRLGDVVAHHPVGPGAADAEHEALEDRLPLGGVRHLGMELDAVESASFIRHPGNRAARRRGHQREAGRQRRHLVAMTHPHGQHAVAGRGAEVLDPLEQPGVAMGPYFGVAELAVRTGLDLATLLHHHREHAVADAQHRHAQLPDRLGGAQVVGLVGTGVTAGENHALDRVLAGVLANPGVADVAGMDFAVDVRLTHAAGDELGDLGSKSRTRMESWATADAGVERGDILRTGGRGYYSGGCGSLTARYCGVALAASLIFGSPTAAQTPPPMATGFDLLAGGTLDVRWISPEGLTVAAPPALDVSTAYVPFTGRGLVAFDIDSGRPRWVADAETTWAPAAGGGLVFVAMTGGVRALDAETGRVAWQRTLPGPAAAPPYWDTGWLVVSLEGGDLVAFRAADGEPLWQVSLGAVVQTAPVPALDALYLGLADGRVVSLDLATGRTNWTRQLEGAATGLRALDDQLVVGTIARAVHSLDLDERAQPVAVARRRPGGWRRCCRRSPHLLPGLRPPAARRRSAQRQPALATGDPPPPGRFAAGGRDDGGRTVAVGGDLDLRRGNRYARVVDHQHRRGRRRVAGASRRTARRHATDRRFGGAPLRRLRATDGAGACAARGAARDAGDRTAA